LTFITLVVVAYAAYRPICDIAPYYQKALDIHGEYILAIQI
jgi:hypothetical protein